MENLNINEITTSWNAFQNIFPTFKSINNEKEYDEMVIILNNLLDVVGNNENHPLASLLYIVGAIIENYENNNNLFSFSLPTID